MNVKQLIYELSQLDPTFIVVRPGYEGGVEEIHYFRATHVDLNVNPQWYFGPHEENADSLIGAVLLS